MRHLIMLASDCLLVLPRSHHFHERLLKKMGFMFLFQLGAQYFLISLSRLPPHLIFGGIIIFLFPCFPVFPNWIAMINMNIKFRCYVRRRSIKIAQWFVEIGSGKLQLAKQTDRIGIWYIFSSCLETSKLLCGSWYLGNACKHSEVVISASWPQLSKLLLLECGVCLLLQTLKIVNIYEAGKGELFILKIFKIVISYQ